MAGDSTVGQQFETFKEAEISVLEFKVVGPYWDSNEG